MDFRLQPFKESCHKTGTVRTT